MFTRPIAVFRRLLSARLETVDSMCFELSQILDDARRGSEDFACDLLLREILLNAVTHGCSALPDAMVKCKITLFDKGIQITVQDPGAGFDRKDWLMKPYDPEKDSGRGLMIVRQYAWRYRFNAAGNCLSVQRKFAG